MVYDYLITLKKPNNRFVNQVGQLMYVFSILAFGFFYYQYPSSGILYLVLIIAILLWWIYTLYRLGKTGTGYFRLGFLFAAFGWLAGVERNIWMGLLYVAAAILEKQVKFPKEVGFSIEEITFNTLPKRRIKWNEVSNVLIKDGMLTVDQKNNKLFQDEIEGEVSMEMEKEFNTFCQEQILASAFKEDKE